MAVSKQDRIFGISGWLLMVGFGLLAVSLSMIALTLPIQSGVEAWVGQNTMRLRVADELIAVGVLMILVATLLMYDRLKKRRPISSSITMAVVIAATIGAIAGIISPLGRLVYSINGFPVATGEDATMIASQVFAGVHWLNLMLAPYIVALSIAESLVRVEEKIVIYKRRIGHFEPK